MRGTIEEPPTGLIPWFSKLREILTLHFAASPSPLQGKPTLAQDIARRISGAVAGECTQKVNIPSTHHNSYLSHYIICHLPLVFLSPTSPLPFYLPSLSQSSSLSLFRLPFSVCLCACLSLWLCLRVPTSFLEGWKRLN